MNPSNYSLSNPPSKLKVPTPKQEKYGIYSDVDFHTNRESLEESKLYME